MATLVIDSPAIHHQYRDHARDLSQDDRSNLPDVMTMKTQPHQIGIILRSLAVWEPHVRKNKDMRNWPVELAKGNPQIIEQIESTFSDHHIRGPMYYIAKGACAVVCRVRGARVLRLTKSGEIDRIESRHVLQAEEAGPIGDTGLRYEILRLAETQNARMHNVNKLRVDLALEGNFMWDAYPDNIGKIDMNYKVLDAGATWTQAKLLENGHEKDIELYKKIRRERKLPELLPA